jgi:hypothetical protein
VLELKVNAVASHQLHIAGCHFQPQCHPSVTAAAGTSAGRLPSKQVKYQRHDSVAAALHQSARQ